MTAATPGQALYEAIRDAFPGDDYWPWDSLDADTQARYGQVAAREPQPAPRVTEAQLSEALDGLSVDIHDGTCLAAGIIDRPHEVARALRIRLEHTYEPQPAPGRKFGIALAALHEISGADDGDGADLAARARQALEDIKDVTEQPQPAPELAAPSVYVTYDGDTHWLECVVVDRSDEDRAIITPIDAGDSWDALAAKVREHQTEHGCPGRQPHGADELAEPVTVAAVAYRDYPSLVAAMQAEIDRERTARLHMAGERDEARSDMGRTRRVILASGKTHQWKIQQLLAIAGEIPADEQEQPAPELAAAMAESRHYREGLQKLHDDLMRSAAATNPSKKSSVEISAARHVKAILDGR